MAKNKKDPNSLEDTKEKGFSKQYTPEDAIKANLAIPQEDVATNLFDVKDNVVEIL